MDDQYMHNQPQVVTLQELEKRRGEFEVPDGAVEALKAGSAPVVVFLRSTGDEYQLVDTQDKKPARTTDGQTDSL